MNDISNIKIKTDIAYPEYVTVIRKCMDAVTKAYPKRGNNWKYENKEYWITRLRNELSEFENAGTNEQQQGKLINIINFCSMMHHIINTIPSYAEYYDDEKKMQKIDKKKKKAWKWPKNMKELARYATMNSIKETDLYPAIKNTGPFSGKQFYHEIPNRGLGQKQKENRLSCFKEPGIDFNRSKN